MSAPRALDGEQDRIDEEASGWIVLRNDRELSDEEEREFDAWLAADPRHHRSWQELSSVWATIPALPGLADLVPPHDVLVEREGNPWPSRISRRSVAGLSAIAAVFVGLFMIPSMLSGPAHYETGLSQTQLLTLDDGSQVTLAPHSRLTVKFEDGERRVALSRGEAFFEVTHDASRPFFVEAGGATTRVLGTKFDVNYGMGSVRVGVLEGLVQVRRTDPNPARGASVAYLRAGQGAEVMLADGARPITLMRAQAPGAWREGRLIYENSRLADLAADVNRYYPPGVTLANPQLADLRITASFKPSEIGAFMSAVGNVVPVKVNAGADGSFRLEPAAE